MVEERSKVCNYFPVNAQLKQFQAGPNYLNLFIYTYKAFGYLKGVPWYYHNKSKGVKKSRV